MSNLKHVSEISFADAFAPQEFTPEFKADTEPLINQLFKELRSICSAWRQAWPDQKTYDLARDNWIKAFIDAGVVSWQRVEYGLRKQRLCGNAFIPSPAEFIALCTPEPEEIGLPSIDKAFSMAAYMAHPSADRSKCNQVVYHAACEAGFNMISTEPSEKSYRVFKKYYAAAIELLIAGGTLRELPLPPERMISAKPSGDGKKTGQEQMTKIKEIMQGIKK